MKKFSEYILTASVNEEELLTEGFLNKLSKWLGGNLGKVKGGIKNFTQELRGLPEKTMAVYQVTMRSIEDISDPGEKEAVEKLLNQYDNCKNGDDIAKANMDYLRNNKFPKSKFSTGLIVVTYDLLKKSNDSEIKGMTKEIPDLLKEQDNTVKKEVNTAAEETINNKKEENVNKEEGNKVEPTVTSDGETVTQKEEEPKVEDNVDRDPLSSLSKAAGLESRKLKDSIMYLIFDDNKDKSSDDLEKLSIGLGAIICGAKIIGDDEKLSNDILKGWGIESIKTFTDELLKEVE